MQATNDHGTPCPAKSAMPLFLCLTAAGLCANWSRLPLFLDVEFLFGSIFALLALQFLGPGRGLLAGLLISSITYQFWNHPYAIVILTIEVAVVGWLYGRRKMGLVMADTLYWCLIGMPLTYLFYLVAMHVPLNSVGLIATKQTLNGIGNALIARIVFSGWRLATHRGGISLREAVFNLLVLFVLFPSLLLLTISSRADFNATEQNVRTHLVQTSHVATDRLKAWLANRQHPIAYLATLAETMPPDQMQNHLEKMLSADTNFLRIGLMDAEATAIAYAPLLDDLGQNTIGTNFADRPYFDQLRQTLKPQFSEIMMGRVGRDPGPIVAIMGPVLVEGEFMGYVGGVLDLKGLQDYLKLSIAYQSMNYTLLDKQDQVILSNVPEQKAMAPFSTPVNGVLHQLAGGLGQWVPTLPANVPAMERWQKSFYVAESDINLPSGWKLVFRQSLEPVQARLNAQFANRLTLLFGLLLVALAMASLLSQKINAAFELLMQVSSDLPAKIGSGESVVWPQSGLCEAAQMIANFKEVSETLKKKFVESTDMNATLEQRVVERTISLQESEARYRELFEAESDAIVLVDNQSGQILEANNAAAELYQYDHDEMLTKKNTDFSAEPEQTRQISVHGLASSSGLPVKIPLRLHHKKDGTVFPVEITGRFFMLQGRSVHIAAIRDITERKQAEELLRQALKEKEVLIKEVHHRVKNNMQVIYSLLNLQAKGITDETIRTMFEESRNRVNSMALIHEKLYQAKDLSHIDFKEYLQSLIQGIANTYSRHEITLSVEMATDIALDVNIGIPCGLIVNELVSNSLKHAFPAGQAGTVRVGLGQEGPEGAYLLTVSDNGIGCPAGLDFKNTSSLGLQLVNVLTGQLHGTISLKQTAGSEFSITFPNSTKDRGNQDG